MISEKPHAIMVRSSVMILSLLFKSFNKVFNFHVFKKNIQELDYNMYVMLSIYKKLPKIVIHELLKISYGMISI